MIVFYMMIVRILYSTDTCQLTPLLAQATCAWFYTGQPELTVMLACPQSVADFLLTGGGGEGGHGAAGGEH